MDEKITLCGDDCAKCPRYTARTEPELRAAAELWYKVGWRDRVLSDPEIACSGCSPVKPCTYQLVECTQEHRVSKCRHCVEFPCGKIQNMLKRSEAYETKCREVCSKQEYDILESAFFNKERNLKK